MTDAQIVKNYREREEIKKKIAALQALVNKRTEKIVSEMQSRRTRMIEHDGQRVTLVQPEPVVIDEEKARTILRRTQRGRIILKRATIEVLDKKALSSEIQLGHISAAVAAKFTHVKPSAPYITGSKN